MARKTKDLKKETDLIEKKSVENEENIHSLDISSNSKGRKTPSTKKESKSSSKKEGSTKSSKKTSKSKESPAKAKISTKKETTKISSKSKKNTDTKNTAKKSPTKNTVSKKSNTSTRKKSRSKIKIKNTPKLLNIKYISSKKIISKKFKTEYYDLPFSYNQTVVKILAQTPTTLFVYWELSKKDVDRFKQTYGDNFFEITKPVLILYNDTLNYVYEIEINDFANSWYINVKNSKCDYHVELGRKPIHTSYSNNNTVGNVTSKNGSTYIPYYIYITTSNKMVLPNDKILFPQINSKIIFRNIKTGTIKEKNLGEFKFITNYGIFTIQELYKSLYPNENFEYEEFLRNPSSGLRSSVSSR